jgi:hypothetical protein
MRAARKAPAFPTIVPARPDEIHDAPPAIPPRHVAHRTYSLTQAANSGASGPLPVAATARVRMGMRAARRRRVSPPSFRRARRAKR